jgi:hypothetical protein
MFNADAPSAPPSFPPAGSYNSTISGQTYPIAYGGGYVEIDGVQYANQVADFYVLNDGFGGTYTDFTSAQNVQYTPYGGSITSTSFSTYVTINTYWNGTPTVVNGGGGTSYYHDGTGGFYSNSGVSYYSYGTEIYSESQFDSNYGYYEVYRYYTDGGSGYYSNYSIEYP